MKMLLKELNRMVEIGKCFRSDVSSSIELLLDGPCYVKVNIGIVSKVNLSAALV